MMIGGRLYWCLEIRKMRESGEEQEKELEDFICSGWYHVLLFLHLDKKEHQGPAPKRNST